MAQGEQPKVEQVTMNKGKLVDPGMKAKDSKWTTGHSPTKFSKFMGPAMEDGPQKANVQLTPNRIGPHT